MPTKAQTTTVSVAKVDKILERSAEFYENALWNSEAGQSVRARLGEAGIGPKVLREFEIGYAPVQPRELLADLSKWPCSATELLGAGVVTQSGRKHLHARFHSRIMFPIRDREGHLRGFAGLATHLGPSWPLWLCSPEGELFQRGGLLFGLQRVERAIAKAGHAVVLNDGLEALRLQGAGSKNAVAAIQSPITEAHLELLADVLSLAPEDIASTRLSGGGRGATSVTLVGVEGKIEDSPEVAEEGGAMRLPARPAKTIVAAGKPSQVLGDLGGQVQPPSPWQRLVRFVGAAVIGAGLPLLWLAIVSPGNHAGGERGYRFAMVGLAVGASYAGLALIAARVSARARARSDERRMRAPYLIGVTEWQPPAWTYHRIEDLMIAAAVVSMLILVALFMTIGGFTGWNTD